MNNIVYQDINLLLESYSVLTQRANPEASYNIRHKLSTAASLTPEKEVIYTKLLHYFDAIEAHLHLPADRVDFFFKEKDAECIGNLFLKVCLDYDDLNNMLTEIKYFTPPQRFEHLRVALINALVSTPEALLDTSKKFFSESELFEGIFANTELSSGQKYDLFYIYYHYEQLLEEFLSFIAITSNVIEPLLVPFKKEIAALIDHISPNLQQDGLGYFAKTFGINVAENSGYHFYPCVTSALSMTFTNMLPSVDAFHIFFGIYVLPLMALKQSSGPTDKDMSDFLKALSDPSKLQILKILRTERVYASQLAEKLGVSNATISHHMNVLLQLRIINYEKEQNKFYYSLEKEQFKAYLDQLGAWFTF